jgi:pimeloyl-ACP methyl ester carboxylesterase
MQPASVEYLWGEDRSEAAVDVMAKRWHDWLVNCTLEQFLEDDGSDPERWLSVKYGQMFYDGMRKALREGWAGTTQDILAFQSPWGFDVRDIRVPVTVVGGVLDYAVPIGHARWQAAHIPGARLMEFPDDGHSAVLVSGYVQVLREWAAQRGR